MSRRAGGVVALAIVAAAALWAARRFAAPGDIRLVETVADLVASFDAGAVLDAAPDSPPRIGTLRPSRKLLDMAGRFRRSIVAPPPARVRFQVDVPADSHLELSLGVEGAQQRDDAAAGIRFAVAVAGREVFAHELNPAGSRHDRRWYDARIPLTQWSGQRVEITLATALARPGAPAAGLPGWSHVRVVRETSHARQPARPGARNVVVLLVDTLRADSLGCYGATPSPSPVLDALAARGLVFTDAVAQSSWTMPSVASIFTGLHPRSHGVVGARAGPAAGGGTLDDADRTFLPDTLPTLAEHAARGGITTVGVSANPLVSRETSLARGFETFVEFGWDTKTRNFAADAATVNAAFLAWLREHRGVRFLAYLQYIDPHAPYRPGTGLEAPAALRPAVATGDPHALAEELRTGGQSATAAELAHLRALYDAEVRAWDAALAPLLDQLTALGVLDETVVVVTADHGEEFAEHGAFQHGAHLYDETIRVPLVIVGPSVPAGRTAEQAQGVDLLPTLLGLLDLPVPSGLPGENLLAPRTPRPAISETRYGEPDGRLEPRVSVRVPGWKLIHSPASGRYELYDLSRDPGEHENRFADEALGRTLMAALASWREHAPAAPPPTRHDPRVHEKLRALGYVD